MLSPDTTAAEVLAEVELTGRHAVVTGGYRGIGLALAAALIGRGCRVTLLGPDSERGTGVADAMGADAHFLAVDLADLDAVREVAGQLAGSAPPIDLLIANAAVMAVPEQHVDGIERHLLVNHVGHAALIGALRHRLAPDARVIAVTSESAGLADFDFDDPQFAHRDYDAIIAYGQSKTAVMLYAAALDRRFRDEGAGRRAVAASPGLTRTDLGRYLTRDTLKALFRRLPRDRDRAAVTPRTAEQGAATLAYAATSPEPVATDGPTYCVDLSSRPFPGPAADPADAERLWSLTERLLATGVRS